MGRSPENYYLSKIDREGNPADRQHYVESEIFDNKIAKTWNKVRPRYGDFLRKKDEVGTFPLNEITKDRLLVEQIKKGNDYVKERADFAVGLEYIMMEGIHEHGWLGDNASITPTLEYDDIVNGIDMTVTFTPDGESPLLLGIDTTTSGDDSVIDKKLHRTARTLIDGNLSTVKYYIDDQTGDRKQITVPRVVIATSPETAKELMETLTANAQLAKNDSVQIEILDEVIEQLLFGLEMMKNHGSTSNIEIYERLLKHLELVQKEKSPTIKENEGRARELISDAVKRQRQHYLTAA